jgi:hypothetical protein
MVDEQDLPRATGVVVVVPTMGLGVLADPFAARVQAVLPGAEIVFVLNGPAARETDVDSVEVPPGVHLVVCEGFFSQAVLEGIRFALSLNPSVIVRMDSQEHPPEVLPSVLSRLDEFPVWVIDLQFTPGMTVVPGTADSYHNRFVIPALTATHTDGNVELSGAHGFMVFSPAAAAQVLPFVEMALSDIEGHDPPVVWGGDTALVVCAQKLGFPVAVHRIAAVEMRNRPEEKCVVQLRDQLLVVTALEKLRTEHVRAAASRGSR